MAILIANIGTSDLAVKIDDFYFPMGFDPNEPTIDYSGLTPDEETAWKTKDEFIAQQIGQELNLNTSKIQFRELTENILKEYLDNPTKWQERILPGGFYGVIAKAYHEFEVKKAYIFITNQNPPQAEDTAYLFDILKAWLANRYRDLTLIPVAIPQTIIPTNQDGLLEFYYRFFRENFGEPQSEEVVLVSIKGGTNQMETALKLQAITSGIPNLLFIEPILSIKNILNGQTSECVLTSYWKYFRQQKYQIVAQLLQGWDFGGAIAILRSWQKVLKFLNQYQVIGSEEITRSRENVDLVIKALSCACCLFNLDLENGQKILKDNPKLASANGLKLNDFIGENKYESLLNLYTTALINRELNQIGIFLISLSSFQEGLLYKIIEIYGGLREREPKLNYRYINRNYIELLLELREKDQGITGIKELWLQQRELLEGLDYWLEQRNNLIHGIEGISLNKIHDLNDERPPKACAYRDITLVMAKLLKNNLLQLPNEYKEQFVNGAEYYIYSNVKEWAIATLESETHH